MQASDFVPKFRFFINNDKKSRLIYVSIFSK